MWQFIAWLLLSAILFILGTVSSLHTTDAWNKWRKKNTENNSAKSKPKVEIKDSNFQKSPIVVDSPGSVVGENIYVNSEKPDRQLDDQFKFKLLQRLTNYKGRSVKLLYVMQDREAFNFAEQIRMFLIQNGWVVAGPNATMFFSKQPLSGVHVNTRGEKEVVIDVYSQ